jgi:hypothetical protein
VQTPQTLGYSFSVWSVIDAKHLEKRPRSLGDDRLRSILAERVLVQAACHGEGKRDRSRVRASGELKVSKSLRKNAGEVLIFQDEVERLTPGQARMWAGGQPEVPGKNRKVVLRRGPQDGQATHLATR